MNIEKKILLNPGPATTSDLVKYAQVVPDICPREDEFVNLMKTVSKELLAFVTDKPNEYSSVLFGGSGTAGMDVVINSVIAPNKKLLIINNGDYCERFKEIAKTYNIEVIEIKYELFEKINIEDVENILISNPEIEYIATVHHETSSGILNPVKEIGELSKKYNKCFILDAISTYGVIPMKIEELNVDFMISTSNKCIQGMPGLCFIFSKIESLELIKNYPKRSYYLDLYSQYANFEKSGEMRFTPPVQTVYALKQAINELKEEGGVEKRFQRYSKLNQLLIKGVEKLGFEVITPKDSLSNILFSINTPNNFNFKQVHDQLYKLGFTIYPGKVSAKNNYFRLATMGNLNQKDIEKFLETFEKILN